MVGTLIVLEGLLSADNALVLALLVRHLGRDQQQRALSLGLLMAFVLRGIGILLAGFIISLWWLCGIGAAYLIFLAGKHFASHGQDDSEDGVAGSGMSYARTITMVGITDVVFAVDSILVAVALVNTHAHPDKLWVVYVGGGLGVVLLRLAAGAFIRLIRRYPTLDNTAYALVAWAGIKLGFTAAHLYDRSLPEMSKMVFWIVFAAIVVVGVVAALRSTPNEGVDTDDPSETIAQLCDTGGGPETNLSLPRRRKPDAPDGF